MRLWFLNECIEVNRKTLGNTDISVSELCLGTMYFGTKVDTANARSIMDVFCDHGGNFIDTANNYSFWVGGNGEESEFLIGKWMAEQKNRHEIVLATKVGAMPTDRNDPSSPLEGLRKDTIIKGLEDSLRRLKTDYVDLFYIHADLQEYPLEERWEALFQLEKEGKIRAKGCSNYELDRLQKSEQLGKSLGGSGSAALQQKMSYLHPEQVNPSSKLKFVDKEIIDFVEANEMSLLTFSVLLSGAYEKSYEDLPENYWSAENKERFAYVQKMASEEEILPSQWVLRWVKSQSERIIPLIGCSSVTQLKTNLEAFGSGKD